MGDDLVARAGTTIAAPVARVWDALVDPAAIKEYMFGAEVVSDWKQGSPIVWRGEWQGRRYEDKGQILRLVPPRLLEYSHFSPLSGAPDRPENYHRVTVELFAEGDATRVALAQDNNPTEEAREHSRKNWNGMLDALKTYLER